MDPLTKALIIIAIILLTINVIFDTSNGNFTHVGYLANTDGFTPPSHAYEPSEPVFTPEGYGSMGQFHNFITMPYAYRHIKEPGLSRTRLQELYPAVDNFDLITLA